MFIGMPAESGQLNAILAAATDHLSDRADAVLVRDPPIDRDVPESSDIDLLAIGTPEDFLPERFYPSGGRQVDVMWVPRTAFHDLPALAAQGLIPHRILSSRRVFDRTGGALTSELTELARLFETPDLRTRRIAGLMEMGYATVREIGVSWDAPAVALFWLHMAHAACLAALCDGLGRLCPNVYTRPTEALRWVDAQTGQPEAEGIAQALRLDADLPDLVARLRRFQSAIAARFPEPDWPNEMREMTRWEYRYFADPRELTWRIRVAEELAARGDQAGAVFYLRFHAYALARLPMVAARAEAGGDENFLRPSQRVGPEFARLCPDLAEDLSILLGGAGVERAHVTRALDHLRGVRARTLSCLAARDLHLPDLPHWQPFEDTPAPRDARLTPKKETYHARTG